jgi:hypothetical protein
MRTAPCQNISYHCISISQSNTQILPKHTSMTNFRSNLPVPESRLPQKTASPAYTPEDPVQPASQIPSKLQTPSQQRRIPTPKGSKLQSTRTRTTRPVPVSSEVLPATGFLSTEPPKPWNPSNASNTAKVSIGDGSGSMSSSPAVSSSMKERDSDKTESSPPTNKHSKYNGPQLVEPCVGNALFHVLEPCGHRVMTRDVQLCGQNCKGSDSAFASKKTQAKFICATCISRYVHEHYAAKKSLFIPSLDMLEKALGGFRDGWKEKRIARMDRVWRNDALEEQRALEKLGRRCEAVPTDPDEERLVEDEEERVSKLLTPAVEVPVEVQTAALPVHRTETKTGRLRIPMAKQLIPKSQPATSPSVPVVDKNAVESQREVRKRTRIPVGPRLPRR